MKGEQKRWLFFFLLGSVVLIWGLSRVRFTQAIYPVARPHSPTHIRYIQSDQALDGLFQGSQFLDYSVYFLPNENSYLQDMLSQQDLSVDDLEDAYAPVYATIDLQEKDFFEVYDEPPLQDSFDDYLEQETPLVISRLMVDDPLVIPLSKRSWHGRVVDWATGEVVKEFTETDMDLEVTQRLQMSIYVEEERMLGLPLETRLSGKPELVRQLTTWMKRARLGQGLADGYYRLDVGP